MIDSKYKLAAIAGGLAMMLGGCADPQAMGEINTKIAEIQAQQKDILTKLDVRDRTQAALRARQLGLT